jgi:hypothetical protein
MWSEDKFKFKVTVRNIPEEELKLQYINQYRQKKSVSYSDITHLL